MRAKASIFPVSHLCLRPEVPAAVKANMSMNLSTCVYEEDA